MKEILHFSGQKSFLMLLRKNPRKGKFWQREEEDASPPPLLHPFLDKMTKDIQIAKILGSLLKLQIVNSLKLEVNGL